MATPPVTLTGTIAAAAATADAYVDITAPYDGTIVGAAFVPVSDITGANTNSRTVKVVNRGQSGSGTVQPAIVALTSGVNAKANREKKLTLSSTPADLVVVKGDVLRVTSLHVGGSGLAAPQLDARIKFVPTVATGGSGEAPLSVDRTTQVAGASAGNDADGGYVEAPFDGTVTAASVIAEAALTGADTDSRTISLYNRGQAGSGTTKVAETAFTNGVNAAADDETALTLQAAGNLAVKQGDVLEFVSTHIGSTGLAGPAFTGKVTFSRN